MPIVVIGLSHRTSPVEVRERFAFSEERVPETLARMRAVGLAEEGVILSTCNRVELYAVASADDPSSIARLRDFMIQERGYAEPLGGEVYGLGEPESLEHLFRVACGLDSMVLGETEILGQMKKAYDLALRSRQTGACLNRAFQRAFNVAKQVRSETNIQRGNISVASVAVDLAERIFASLEGRRVMVVGAGDTSEKTARALLGRGAANLIVANRSPERAAALASALGGEAVSFDTWTSAFDTIDILISSTASTECILDRAKLEPHTRKRRSPLLLVDIAVPRDIDPEVNLLEGVYLYNIDDLQAIAADGLQQRREEVSRCEALIRSKVEGLLGAIRKPAPIRPAAPVVVEGGERVNASHG
ncbi:MAG: glutamyl-tRNA reductase [Verrucomicrobia bacterium]|nr:glutamyl-tRNA reductase [Verrucomicrobiota bacterium]